jgi:biopolymer transport protein TolQ
MLPILPLAAVNAFFSAYSQSDFFGKLIFLGLISLSIICWVILIHKTWLMRKVRNTSQPFLAAIEQNKNSLFSLELHDLPKPRIRDIPHPYAEIFLTLKQKAVELLNKNHFFVSRSSLSKEHQASVYLSQADIDLIESCALTTISTQAKKLEKNLFILSTIATLAPFLGLLGTVWGILITFSELHSGSSASSNAAVLGGLSTALATTVLGLVIAIPALISYNYLKNTHKNLSSDMEDFLYLLLSNIELQYRKTDVN